MAITITVDAYAAEAGVEFLRQRIAADRAAASMIHATESERELSRLRTMAADRLVAALDAALAVDPADA